VVGASDEFAVHISNHDSSLTSDSRGYLVFRGSTCSASLYSFSLMSGLEIFGAVAAAVTLLELAKSCSNLLKRHTNTHRDISALAKRVEVLTGIVSQVSEVLHSIRLQNEGHGLTTDAELIIWQRMEGVLGLCQNKMTELNTRLTEVLSKTTRPKLAMSNVPADIVRHSNDLKTYIQALDMLRGLFQL
jgi:hypothetical protein